jgi:hypothetical protein
LLAKAIDYLHLHRAPELVPVAHAPTEYLDSSAASA